MRLGRTAGASPTSVAGAGRWPHERPPHLVALLPKGGTDDRRPIVRLSVLYQLWATALAGLVRDWLRGAGVLGAGAAAAADTLAGLLGLKLDEAHAWDEPLVGLASDFSKLCFFIRHATAAAGIGTPARPT